MGSFTASQFEYDVFLSFRGLDVRRHFLIDLLGALIRAKVTLFVGGMLTAGEGIVPSLFRAIKGSQISLIIFSENYASSKHCLTELVNIIVCAEKNNAQIVIPVFYNIDRTWESLTAALGFYGLHSSNFGNDAELIEAIVKLVLQRLNHPWQENLVSDSGSFAYYDDNDSYNGGGETEEVSSSVIDEPTIHKVLLKGSFRRPIISWRKGELLGSGSYGRVHKVFTNDGFSYAVKEVCLKDEGSHAKQRIFGLLREMSHLIQLGHKNIVQYIGMDMDSNMLYIVLELVTKGSLERLYHKYKLRDSQVSGYTRQILSGLKYLHDHGVIHRDIKCANVLLDENGTIKLADFGLAKAIEVSSAKTSIGSLCWMAPEVADPEHRSYGLKADIWSLGCTVLEMLTKKRPYFPLDGIQAMYKLVTKGELPHIPESLSIDARDFIGKCLQLNPSDRPTAAELLDYPFVKGPSLSPTSPVSPLNNL